MISRCYCPTDSSYALYGGRGVRVCERWRRSVDAFLSDMGPRPAGRYPSGRAMYSLDRIDPNGDYEPGNCRWTTAIVQGLNRRVAPVDMESFRRVDAAYRAAPERYRGLTAQQGRVLALLRERIREFGVAPTMREIAKVFGWSSTNAVGDVLAALVRKGAIVRTGKVRGITIVNEACPHCGHAMPSKAP